MRRQSTRTGGTIAAILAGTVVLFFSAIVFAGTPTLGIDCGATGASIAGSDAAGKVTLGVPDPTIPGTGMCTLTFSTSYPNPPACSAMNETNGGGFPAPAGTRTTNSTLVIGSSVGSNPGDVISYHCQDY